MGKTTIEWTQFSVNPIRARNRETGKVGHWCEKVSPGCKFCYASRLQPRFGMFPYLAEHKPQVEPFLDKDVLQSVIKRRKPTTYFWCDMTDMFLWPDDWIMDCFVTMDLTRHHTHQVLTKRSREMKEFMQGNGWVPNVWLGVSVENRATKYRIDDLRETPAALRFLSLEPLLEDLGTLDLRGIGWVIVGGESGPEARPCHIKAVRSIIRQCREARVPSFVKQFGAFPVVEPCGQHHFDFGEAIGRKARFLAVDRMHPATGLWRVHFEDRKGGDPDEWPEDLRVREMPEVRR